MGTSRIARIPVIDAITALALCLATQVEIWAPTAMVGVGSVDGSRPILAATAAVGTLALALRRTAPLVSCVLVYAAWGLQGVLTTPTQGLTGLICLTLSAYSVAAHSTPLRAAVGATAVLVGVTALARDLADWAFVLAVVSASWIAGFALHRRRSQVTALDRRALVLERDRDEAVERERGRIARELHDVVSHHVMTTVVQAQAARAHLGDEAVVCRSLDAIDEGGRAALAELRALLGLLRGDETDGDRSPQPSLANVSEVVERTRDAGVPVALQVNGDPRAVPSGVSLAAYRVVQEALTNVLRHGDAAATEVTLDVQLDGVRVMVTDRGPGSGDSVRAGHGLIGMAERAALYGGSVVATDGAEGGFVVDAWFPCEVLA